MSHRLLRLNGISAKAEARGERSAQAVGLQTPRMRGMANKRMANKRMATDALMNAGWRATHERPAWLGAKVHIYKASGEYMNMNRAEYMNMNMREGREEIGGAPSP